MKNERKEKSINKIVKDTAVLDLADSSIKTDPLGMWTGVPDNPYEKPVQDADDL